MNEITPEQLAKSNTEHGHQAAVFCWIAQIGKYRWPDLNQCFAIPNGGLRERATAARLKSEGVKPGVPDIFLPVAYGYGVRRYHGCFIEMKKPGKRKDTSGEQDQYITYLIRAGYYVEVCDHWLQAVDVLTRYMSGNLSEYSLQNVNGRI